MFLKQCKCGCICSEKKVGHYYWLNFHDLDEEKNIETKLYWVDERNTDGNFQTIWLDLYPILVYTTQVNRAFCVRWLASLEVISQVLRTAEQKQNGFWQYIVTTKVTLWTASYWACVVYTITIIHLSVGKSVRDLPPLRWSKS